MKGKIVITTDDSRVDFDMQIQNVSPVDQIIIFDAMARALRLDEEDRMMVGAVVALGIEKLTGAAPTEVCMPHNLEEMLRGMMGTES